jgi:hypothetical protein
VQGTRRLLAIVVACLLTPAVPAGGARTVALGIVVQANLANLGTHPVTEGSSVYSGEALSTGERGSLQMRSGAVIFQLMSDSSAVVRGDADVGTQAFHAELAKGEAALSMASVATGEICAQGACVRGAGPAPILMRMGVAGPKELRVYVKRGTATLSYRGETAKMPEGSSYVVVLDPPDDQTPQPGARGAIKPHHAFLLIAIAAAAVAVTVPLILKGSAYESPDRP